MQTIDTVLDYWFGDQSDLGLISDEQAGLWWGKSEQADDDIRQQFGALLNEISTGGLQDWRESPRGMMALVICTDQFPRNIFRDTPKAFSFDSVALGLARTMLERNWHLELRSIERVFLYLPFEHSEKLEDQHRSVALFEALSGKGEDDRENEIIAGYLEYAIKHRVFIERFGRFPHRNVILGRDSTEEEIRFLKQPGSSF